MKEFTFCSPTKIIFGRGVVSKIGGEARTFGTRALLVYGGGSIKKSGLYDQISGALRASGIEFKEHSGVSPNPLLSHAEEGVRKAKEWKAEFIIAAGGGSVIDEGKAIAAGTGGDRNLWDYYDGKAAVEKALPVIAVQTLPATSSETNEVSVLTNEETKEKFGLRSPRLVPSVSFLDPQLTFTIPLKYTSYACFDIMSHMLEGYFTMTESFAPVHEGFAEGLCTAVKAGLERILKKPDDYDARAAVMWAGALAWNGITNAGLEGASIPNHMFAHPLGSVHDMAHGAALAIIFPVWMDFKKHEISGRIIKFGEKIMGMKGLADMGNEIEAADAVIAEFRAWLKAVGCPSDLREAGIKNPDMDELVKQTLTLSSVWGIKGYSAGDMEEIFRRCAGA